MQNKQYRVLIICLFSLLIFSSCKKYEYGPAISLRSKENRLCKIWVVDETTEINNEMNTAFHEETAYIKEEKKKENYNNDSKAAPGDNTTPTDLNLFPSILLEFQKEGLFYKYFDSPDSIIESGNWRLYNNKKGIITTIDGTKDTIEILKLKNNAFWIKDDNYELHCTEYIF